MKCPYTNNDCTEVDTSGMTKPECSDCNKSKILTDADLNEIDEA